MFKYLDIPQIPESIIPSRQELLDLPYKEKTNFPSTYIWFRNKHCTGLVNEWIQDTLKVKVHTQYQFVLNGIPRHKDSGRHICMNYILYPGGPNVSTNFYEDDKETLVHSEIIKEKTWHTILTYLYHDVTNIDPNDIRIAIGCTPVDERQYALDMFNYTIPIGTP